MTPPLPQERVRGYLRALATALDRLGPNEDCVPLAESLALLHGLSPELSGPLLAPAELSPVGMPAYSWLARVQAEQILAHQGSDDTDTSAQAIERAQSLEPELGARVAGRRDLHRFLRRQAVLPGRRITGALRRRKPTLDLRLYFDHIDPLGRWVRIVVDLRGPMGTRVGPVSLGRDAVVRVESGMRDLLLRHATVPLVALHAQLVEVCGQVTRLSRTEIGPFWFPGVVLPAGVPPQLGKGLALHLTTDVVAQDISQSHSQDPLRPDPGPAPADMQRFVGRRVACSRELVGPLEAWAQSAGVRLGVQPI